MIISQSGMIDLVPEYNRALRPIFCVSEGDADSRMINLTVKNAGELFTIPEGASVYVAGKKLDNTIFTYECSHSGYIVTFPITEQMSAVSGLVLCEIQIVVAGDPLGSANFCFWVEPSPIENGSTSSSDLNIFTEAISVLGDYSYLSREVDVLSSRMDEFARLPDGSLSTAADAELADIRVKADGTTAATAGNAVREQITDLKSAIENGGMLLNQSDFEQGSYNSAGATTSSTTRIRTVGYIPVKKGGVIRFAPGVTTSNIFYGKFNTNKGFITDGPGWGDSDISIDWDGYVILVFKNSTNTTFAPSDYDATTIIMSSVENKAATIAEIAQTENPMNPLLFDMMYFKKGSVVSGTEYSTRYEMPAFINNQFADLNAVSATGSSGYIAFRFNTINQPKVLTSGESIDYYAIVKTNKPLTLKPRLSASTTWSGVFSVAVADSISLSVGYNCVKMHFTYDHTGSSAADNYKYMVFEGNNVFTDLEAEFVFVKGETFLGWVKTLQAAEEEYSTDLLFWGDSLTAGAGGGDTSYPKVCAETLGLSRMNCGVGGESANTIAARQGGNNIIIPVGTVNGSYPIDEGFSDLFGGIVQPLRQGDGAGSGSKILVNGIECNLANSGGNYVISGYTGAAITTPAIGTFVGNSYTGKVVCIFVGQNGSTFNGLSDYNARIAIIESMIKHLDHNRYVILGLSTGTDASREADDRAMLAKFGNKFFPTRKMLVENGMTIAGLTPTAQDTTDISNGTVPTSLRSDSVHLNSYGYTALGKMVAEKIVSLGYLT